MSRGRKRLFILLFLFAVSFTLMSYQHNRRTSFFYVLSFPYYKLGELTSNICLSIERIRSTFEENRILRGEVSRLQLAEQQYREIILENGRLKELLSLKEREPAYVAAARVVMRGADRLLKIAVLDKGERNGIEKGMSVITPQGLVGKVHSVSGSFSDVLLMKDPNFSVAVRLQNSRYEGVVSGTGGNYCLLNYVPPEERVEKGEVVITSGMDGIFPAGVPVGIVTSVRKEGIEFYQRIEVRPFQSSEKLDEVIVLKRTPSGN